MRSFFALAGALWFVGGAILIGDGRMGAMGDPPSQQVIGDPAVMAIHLVARIVFVGFALLSLGLVEWSAVGEWIGRTASNEPSVAAE